MPSLSYSRTGSTAQIYDNAWGANPGHKTIKSNASANPGRSTTAVRRAITALYIKIWYQVYNNEHMLCCIMQNISLFLTVSQD